MTKGVRALLFDRFSGLFCLGAAQAVGAYQSDATRNPRKEQGLPLHSKREPKRLEI